MLLKKLRRNSERVLLSSAMHWNRPNTLQMRSARLWFRVIFERCGYIEMTSCSRRATVPTECHRSTAKFCSTSRRLFNCRKASSLVVLFFSWLISTSVFSNSGLLVMEFSCTIGLRMGCGGRSSISLLACDIFFFSGSFSGTKMEEFFPSFLRGS